jgi:GNAT superfamily N-acetyltransferase
MALIEEFLGREGSEVRIEVGPFSDPTLTQALAERRFAIIEWNLVLVRTLSDRLRTGQKTDIEVQSVSSGDDALIWAETLTRSFMERDDIGEEEVGLALPMTKTSSLHCFLARTKKGTPIGAAAMGIRDGVATLFGAAVLPLHRRTGAHQALIQVRLDAAIAYGCEIATSSTLPGSAAQRNIERWGFRAAYPKVLMQHEGTQAPRSKRVSFEDL